MRLIASAIQGRGRRVALKPMINKGIFAFFALVLAPCFVPRAVHAQATPPSSAPTPASADSAAPASTDAAPTSTEQGQTLLDNTFETPNREQTVQEKRRQAFEDTAFSGELRTFYMDSNNLNGTQNEAWAIGGSAGLKTGYFRDLFAFGATAYTSQRISGPEDKDGTQLLAPGQHGYSVIGEAYAEVLLSEGIQGSVGYRGYDTPFISRNDSRMTPNTFEAAVVQGSFGGTDGAPGWRFGGGYFDKIKERDSENFVSMAAAAGAPAGVSRGVSVAGAQYKLGNLTIGGIEYYSQDIIDIGYVEVKDAFPLTSKLRLQVAAQYIDQHSVGANLLMGHQFGAEQFGLKAELAFSGALFTTAYTASGKDNDTTLQSPWSAYPGYTVVQVQNFNRSGEEAWMLRAAYNFPMLKNLSAYALYVHGSRPDVVNQYAQQEYDVNLKWNATTGRFKGLTLLARYGHVAQAGPDELHTNQIRLVVYYTLP
jgi:hypothetical protein